MTWWLEGAIFRHFELVRNPQEAIFLSQRIKGKNREKIEKIKISVEIFIDLHRKSIFHRYFVDISVEISEILFPACNKDKSGHVVLLHFAIYMDNA